MKMGFENLDRYRDRFPAAKNLIYLNHAAVAPLSRPCAEAMKWLADDTLNNGSYHYDQWLAAYAGLRSAAARLIHAEPEEIALMKNTSEGIATIANGLDWRPGDTIVAFNEEFPSNQYPWKRLEAKGVKIKWLSGNLIPLNESMRLPKARGCCPSALFNIYRVIAPA